jgi:hypothetical protein
VTQLVGLSASGRWFCQKKCFLPNEPKVVQCLQRFLKNKVLANRIKIVSKHPQTMSNHPRNPSIHPLKPPILTKPETGTTTPFGATGGQSGSDRALAANLNVSVFGETEGFFI